MPVGDRDGLIARIRQVRRVASERDRPNRESTDPPADRVEALEARVAHLEQQLDGLQDSVHRESDRHAKLIAALENRTQPGAMGAALAEDARHRGL
jgi:vacuolar-type H+-ATPase subunit I/STV1